MPGSDRHCRGCGRLDCGGCLPELDPPRYCCRCGAWMATAVTPAGLDGGLPPSRRDKVVLTGLRAAWDEIA